MRSRSTSAAIPTGLRTSSKPASSSRSRPSPPNRGGGEFSMTMPGENWVTVDKQDGVTGLESLPRDESAVLVLFRRVVGKADAHVRVDVHHEARAVEAGRARATPRVPCAQMLLGDGDDALGARQGGLNLGSLDDRGPTGRLECRQRT